MDICFLWRMYLWVRLSYWLQGVFPCFPWTRKLPAHLQPDLDFLAPEYLAPNQHTVTPAADVFSLGVLICWICAGLNSSSVLSNTLQAVQPISCSKNSDKLVRCELLSVLWPQMRPHSIRREGRGNKRFFANSKKKKKKNDTVESFLSLKRMKKIMATFKTHKRFTFLSQYANKFCSSRFFLGTD